MTRTLTFVMCMVATSARADGPLPAERNVSETEDWSTVEEATPEVMTEAMTWYGDAFPEVDRVLNLRTARTARPMSWLFIVQHRATVPLGKDPVYNGGGLDGGNMKIGIATRMGIIDGLDAGLYRAFKTDFENFGTYELDVRWRFLNEIDHYINVAARGGLTWFLGPLYTGGGDAAKNQRLGGFAQVLTDTVLFDAWVVGLQAGFHSRSHNPTKLGSDEQWTVGLGLLTEYRFMANFAWSLEVTQGIAGYFSKYPAITTGPKMITNRHTFSLVVSNSAYMSTDAIYTGTDREFEDLIFGFNITRELGGP